MLFFFCILSQLTIMGGMRKLRTCLFFLLQQNVRHVQQISLRLMTASTTLDTLKYKKKCKYKFIQKTKYKMKYKYKQIKKKYKHKCSTDQSPSNDRIHFSRHLGRCRALKLSEKMPLSTYQRFPHRV